LARLPGGASRSLKFSVAIISTEIVSRQSLPVPINQYSEPAALTYARRW